MIKLKVSGSFDNVFAYLNYLKNQKYLDNMHLFAQKGVYALSAATPIDTGVTANSWRYEIRFGFHRSEIVWFNDSVTYQGDPIVILLHYGHGTGTGGYVQGRDFINPAIRPVFDEILKNVETVVRSL